jgi:hypothetical protein
MDLFLINGGFYARMAQQLMETWLSGRKRHRAKVLGGKLPRGFESHRLRKICYSAQVPTKFHTMINNYSYGHSWMWPGTGFGILGIVISLVIVAILITLKGYALWHAARRSEKGWFIALLILNTLGILELLYLYFIVGKWHEYYPGNRPKTPPTTTPSAPTEPKA